MPLYRGIGHSIKVFIEAFLAVPPALAILRPLSDLTEKEISMDTAKYDVVGIGNAIVDVLAHADDNFLRRHELAKGAMTLIDSETAASLYEEMGSVKGRSLEKSKTTNWAQFSGTISGPWVWVLIPCLHKVARQPRGV
jgi:hypothetical protein